ncbi:hypothetical protein ZIOFF_073377 [Zingiber officinale]|uniref:Protein arginine methyltransferase NDUFAF7 n=1 Tax=Zingiber officinale TaxID=94328 RepID=A0A8J5BBZ0_ZINOF|nr:hypothetical protein ZIOFF_073377 [Zingiber officinale]
MLEVLDNLPHDLLYSPNQVSPWMEVWLEKAKESLQISEVYKPIQDLLIAKCIKIIGLDEDHASGTNRLVSASRRIWSKAFPRPRRSWMPTGCLKLMEVLHSALPKMSLIASDFSYLPEVRIPGDRAPLVSSMVVSSIAVKVRMMDSSVYLILLATFVQWASCILPFGLLVVFSQELTMLASNLFVNLYKLMNRHGSGTNIAPNSKPWSVLQKGGRTTDYDSYLDAKGNADIFFPTDFWLLERIDHYTSVWSSEQKVSTPQKPLKKRRTIIVSSALAYISSAKALILIHPLSWMNLVCHQRRGQKMDTIHWSMTLRTLNFTLVCQHITSHNHCSEDKQLDNVHMSGHNIQCVPQHNFLPLLKQIR